MDLCNPREVRALLDRYGLAPQKGFGQNFLINPDIPERIAESSYSAVRSRPCAALEIGPGIGALTSSLCERFDRVVAVWAIKPGALFLFLMKPSETMIMSPWFLRI